MSHNDAVHLRGQYCKRTLDSAISGFNDACDKKWSIWSGKHCGETFQENTRLHQSCWIICGMIAHEGPVHANTC